jgi:hypothetical protein
MKIYKDVMGSQEQVPKVEINKDTVYLRDNVTKVKDEENNTEFWKYDEKQLTIKEYLRQLIPENDNAIAELMDLFCSYQLQNDEAIAELSVLLTNLN